MAGTKLPAFYKTIQLNVIMVETSPELAFTSRCPTVWIPFMFYYTYGKNKENVKNCNE